MFNHKILLAFLCLSFMLLLSCESSDSLNIDSKQEVESKLDRFISALTIQNPEVSYEIFQGKMSIENASDKSIDVFLQENVKKETIKRFFLQFEKQAPEIETYEGFGYIVRTSSHNFFLVAENLPEIQQYTIHQNELEESDLNLSSKYIGVGLGLSVESASWANRSINCVCECEPESDDDCGQGQSCEAGDDVQSCSVSCASAFSACCSCG